MEDEVGGIAYSDVWAGRTTSGTLAKGSSVSLTCSGGCSRKYSEDGSTPDYRHTAESALHLVIQVNGRYLRYCYDVAATN